MKASLTIKMTALTLVAFLLTSTLSFAQPGPRGGRPSAPPSARPAPSRPAPPSARPAPSRAPVAAPKPAPSRAPVAAPKPSPSRGPVAAPSRGPVAPPSARPTPSRGPVAPPSVRPTPSRGPVTPPSVRPTPSRGPVAPPSVRPTPGPRPTPGHITPGPKPGPGHVTPGPKPGPGPSHIPSGGRPGWQTRPHDHFDNIYRDVHRAMYGPNVPPPPHAPRPYWNNWGVSVALGWTNFAISTGAFTFGWWDNMYYRAPWWNYYYYGSL